MRASVASFHSVPELQNRTVSLSSPSSLVEEEPEPLGVGQTHAGFCPGPKFQSVSADPLHSPVSPQHTRATLSRGWPDPGKSHLSTFRSFPRSDRQSAHAQEPGSSANLPWKLFEPILGHWGRLGLNPPYYLNYATVSSPQPQPDSCCFVEAPRHHLSLFSE